MPVEVTDCPVLENRIPGNCKPEGSWHTYLFSQITTFLSIFLMPVDIYYRRSKVGGWVKEGLLLKNIPIRSEVLKSQSIPRLLPTWLQNKTPWPSQNAQTDRWSRNDLDKNKVKPLVWPLPTIALYRNDWTWLYTLILLSSLDPRIEGCCFNSTKFDAWWARWWWVILY